MSEQATEEKVCPECAETVKAAAKVCRFCGYRFEAEATAAHTPPVAETVSPQATIIVTGGFGKREWFLLWAATSALFMAIGSFGPWVTALGSSVSGTDGHNDGWGVIVVAVIALLLVVSTRRNRGAGLWALIGGVLGAAITIHDRSKVGSLLSRSSTLVRALVHVGWGLNLAMVASISLGICGLIWLLSVESVPVADLLGSPASSENPGGASAPDPR